jgi:delta 1-pyrroline-5-carboxylate dehydrogenase
MKTINKFFAVITVLVFTSSFTYAGSINSKNNQAVTNNSPAVTESKTENLTVNLMADQTEENFTYDLEREAMLFTKWVVDQQEAKLTQNLFAKSEELIEAAAYTKWIVDQEEAKLTAKLYGRSDELIEAAQYTSMLVDQAEAKQMKKVMNAIEGNTAAESAPELLSNK